MSLQEDKRHRHIHREVTEAGRGVVCPQTKEHQELLAELEKVMEGLTFEAPGGKNPADTFDLGLLASLL